MTDPSGPEHDGDTVSRARARARPSSGGRSMVWLREQRPILLAAAAVVSATAMSLALRINAPAWLLPRLHYDDGLFARSAANLVEGAWLGPYDRLTLAKGPSYPLFVAAMYEVHVPLKLAEHTLHLAAGALVAVAAWRLTRSRPLAAATYVLVALNPAMLGAWSSRVSREVFYGSVSLGLVAGVLVFLTYVPALARRGPQWSVPAVVVIGTSTGLVAAAHHLCRDERAWIVPPLVVAAAAGLAHRGGESGGTARRVAIVGCALLMAVTAFVGGVRWVSERNDDAYGTTVTSDLVEGEIARAYTQWQRIEVGGLRRYVPVSRAQRQALYDVSPAAAELEDELEGPLTAWFGQGCHVAQVCDDYAGSNFVWALRDAAAAGGHMVSGGEAQRFFGRIADDIEAACGGELRCTSPGIGPMPPLEHVSVRQLAGSFGEATGYLLTFDVADPHRTSGSGGDEEGWGLMAAALRGVDRDQDAYRTTEARALDRQWPVTVLMVLYRWGGRLGFVLALAGLMAGLATGAGRRHPAALLATAAMLVGMVSRLGFLALVDATSYPAASNGTYLLPGVDFFVVFVALGCWILATVARERLGSTVSKPPGCTAGTGPG